MKKLYALLNAASLVVVILFNYLSATGKLNNTDIAAASEQYMNLFFPAGYAFSIWGLIYTLLIAYVIYQLKLAYGTETNLSKIIEQTGFWFMASSVFNILWIFAFTYDQIGLSLLFMFGIFFSLFKIVVNTKMEVSDSSAAIHAFAWLPISVYIGWITAAMFANIFLYITKFNIDFGFLNHEQLSYGGLIMATIIYFYMIIKRKMRAYGLVGVWALYAIYVRNNGGNQDYANAAIICVILIFIVVLISSIIHRNELLWAKLVR